MIDAAAIHDRFRERGFIVDEAFATALQIMLALEKPLLIEGPAGVGKTESAKVLADVLGTALVRLQCYEGLDAMAALYEWNYPRQMLHARLSEAEGSSLDEVMQLCADHGIREHNMKGFGPELYAKMRNCVRVVEDGTAQSTT